CVSAALNGATTGRHLGSPVIIGKYAPTINDPYSAAPPATELDRVTYAAASTSDVGIACSTLDPGVVAEANVGTYDDARQDPELLTTGAGWRTLVNMDNGGTVTSADFFQASRGQAANSIWHEAMHQWGYQHRDGGYGPDLETTLPYIVGDCIEQI